MVRRQWQSRAFRRCCSSSECEIVIPECGISQKIPSTGLPEGSSRPGQMACVDSCWPDSSPSQKHFRATGIRRHRGSALRLGTDSRWHATQRFSVCNQDFGRQRISNSRSAVSNLSPPASSRGRIRHRRQWLQVRVLSHTC